jgi:hypothetical protein
MRPENFKPPLERVGDTLEHIGIGNKLLNRTLQLRERIDK